MKSVFLALLLSVICGCVSRSKSQARVFEAYSIGQREGRSQQQAPVVMVAGEVKNHSIPWTAELTLAKALLAAEYNGLWEPRQIAITRQGQVYPVNMKAFLMGTDDPGLEAGDLIEVRR